MHNPGGASMMFPALPRALASTMVNYLHLEKRAPPRPPQPWQLDTYKIFLGHCNTTFRLSRHELQHDITMNVECQCGAVSFRTTTPAPLAVYFCHCTQCQKQSSSAFGISATFPAGALPLAALADKLRVFTRPTKSGRTLDCYFCRVCGSRVYHRGRDADGVEGPTLNVKGGLVEGLDTEGAVHIWTRHAVVAVPEGSVRGDESPPPSPR